MELRENSICFKETIYCPVWTHQRTPTPDICEHWNLEISYKTLVTRENKDLRNLKYTLLGILTVQ